MILDPVRALLEPYLQWIRLGAVIVAALAIAFTVVTVKKWHRDSVALQATEARLALEESCEAGSKCRARVAAAEAAQATINAEAMTQYEQEIARLNSRPVERRVIRVCADPGALRDAASAGEPAGAEARGVLRGSAEFDTGPLRELAREADRQVAAYRALRQRDEALAAD